MVGALEPSAGTPSIPVASRLSFSCELRSAWTSPSAVVGADKGSELSAMVVACRSPLFARRSCAAGEGALPVARGADAQFMVNVSDLAGLALGEDAAPLQQDCMVANRDDLIDAVADQQNRFSLLSEPPNAVEGLQAETRIADRQRFVDDEDIRVDRCRYREGQARLHPARIGAERLVDEFLELGEAHDLVQPRGDLGACQAQREGRPETRSRGRNNPDESRCRAPGSRRCGRRPRRARWSRRACRR